MNATNFQTLLDYHRAPASWVAFSKDKDYETVWQTCEDGHFMMQLLGWSTFRSKWAFVMISIKLADLAVKTDADAPAIEAAKKWLVGQYSERQVWEIGENCAKKSGYVGKSVANAVAAPDGYAAYQNASSILNVNDRQHTRKRQADDIRSIIGQAGPRIIHPHVRGDAADLKTLAKRVGTITYPPSLKLPASQQAVEVAKKMAEAIELYLMQEAEKVTLP